MIPITKLNKSNRKEIYIFDIDGCIMPSIFPNIHDPNQNREQIIRDVNEEGKDIRLFPEFIKFYENICKKVALLVFFITGRQQKAFGELTEDQLKKLRKFKHYFILFYPEEYSHVPKTYFQWKIEMITCIFRVFKNSEGIIFRIFDDMGDYFNEIKFIANSLNLKQKCYLINNDNLWESINRQRIMN